MNVYYIDLKNVSAVPALHDALAAQLSLPDYYGRNLDALHDILSERRDLDLIFYNTSGASAAIPEYMERLRKLCRHLERVFGFRIRFYP